MNEDLLRKFDMSCSTDMLNQIKNQYQHHIQSKRKLDKIASVSELIKILTKRSELSGTELKDIAYILRNDELLSVIIASETAPLINTGLQGSVINNQAQVNPQVPHTCNHVNNSNSVPTNLEGKRRVYNMIRDDLGSHWPDFARALNMKEGAIDQLKNEPYREAIQEVLTMHENNCDTVHWRQQLLEALAEIRRNDLKKRVEGLMDRFAILKP